MDPTLLYVAVVTMAGTLPVGFYLGLRYAAARAELHRPLLPHEVLAELRGPLPCPTRPDPGLTEKKGGTPPGWRP